MYKIGTLGALALLTACSGLGTRVGPPMAAGATATRAALAQPGAKGKYAGLVFVSDLDSNAVWICPTNFNDIRRGYEQSSNQLQGVSNPSQLAVDAQGTIYVANAQTDASGAGSITIYPRGATSPSRTLTTGLNTTEGVAVDSAGTVYASNKYQASIVVFPKGKSVPKATITKNLVGPDGLAVDKSGNLYFADSSANDVLELKAGSKAPQSLHLKKLMRPIGVALDRKGNLYVSNMLGAASTVAVYAPGSTSPKTQIVVPGPPYGSENTIGESAMLSVAQPGDILIASAPLTLALVGGAEWFGYTPAVVGFAAGQTQPLWSQYDTTGYDASSSRGNKMRLVIIAAVTLVALGTAHGQSPKARPSCAFNLPLSPAQCARLENGTHRGGRSWASGFTGTLLYTSQPFLSAVDIWAVTKKGFKQTGQLALGAGNIPLGLAVDASQNLYVAISTFGSGTPSVDEFPRGATKPSAVYTSGLSAPIDVAVDGNGTLYVANLYNSGGGGCGQGSGPGGSVVEYDAGSMTPSRTITGFPGCPNGIAADSSGNSYLTYLYYPSSGFVQSDVIEYANKSTGGSPLGLQVPGGPDLGGLKVASNGDLLVENVQDDATLNQILTFPHGSTSPSNIIQYPGVGWGTGFKYFALEGNRIFAPAYVAPNFLYVASTPAEFAYPSGRELTVQGKLGSTGPFAYGFARSPGK